jgi:hypothetical protein
LASKRKRLTTTQKQFFPFTCEDVFRLACPVLEDEWLPGWRDLRELVYTESGFAELGCVFRTKPMPHLMGPATWVNNVFEPSRRIQYSAVNENLVYQIQFNLVPVVGGCDVTLSRVWTALNGVTEEFLEGMERTLSQNPPDLFGLMLHFLNTGKMRRST